MYKKKYSVTHCGYLTIISMWIYKVLAPISFLYFLFLDWFFFLFSLLIFYSGIFLYWWRKLRTFVQIWWCRYSLYVSFSLASCIAMFTRISLQLQNASLLEQIIRFSLWSNLTMKRSHYKLFTNFAFEINKFWSLINFVDHEFWCNNIIISKHYFGSSTLVLILINLQMVK